jgi:type VI secretion system protein ImpC
MAATDTQAATDAAASTTEFSLLDQAIAATKQTEPQQAQELLRTLTEEALKGTVVYKKNLTITFNEAIRLIDQQISGQLAAIMHAPKFQQLEGSWRGLNYLVMNTETGTTLKIRALNLYRDLSRAVEFYQSQLFKKIYENEFGTPGGEPYGTLIGDYEFTNHPEDIETLSMVSNVAAAAFAPFISAASPRLFGLGSHTELSQPRDLAKIFDSTESEDSRFVTLVMPRVLARLPYGQQTKPVEEFNYEEAPIENGVTRPMPHEHFTWMNAAYAMAARLTDAFAKYSWCTAIRGAEGGGKVENLPTYVFTSDDGDMSQHCPTEIAITDRRDGELMNLGILPLCHYKNTDYAVYFGAQTCQKPKKYDKPEATANAAISARLPYIMASSRFAHYLKIMARDKVGSFMEASNCESWLNSWIKNYVNANENAGQETKAKFPLREAQVKVEEIPGKPGSYHAVAHLRPWLQMEELTTSLRMVARIPKMG